MEEMLREKGLGEILPLLKCICIDISEMEISSEMRRLLDKGADPKRVFTGDLLDGSATLTLSALTEVTVEDMRDEDKEEELHSEIGLAIVGVNFTDGLIELLKYIAEEESDSHKDYHTNMRFIEKIESLVDEAQSMVKEDGDD